MIENCHHEKNIELNFNNEPCCIKHLLIMNNISQEYLVSDKFGKYILRIFRNIFEKEKTFIKCNNKVNNDILIEFFSMISKYMSRFYFINKTNLAKYLCKIAFNYYSQEMNYIKSKIKDINIIRNNLSCIYSKEKRYNKSFDIIQEVSNSNNNNINNDDSLIYLNNYIYLYIKSKQKIDKEIINKIEILKTAINQKLNQLIQASKINEFNKISSVKGRKDMNIQEINLYLFIYFNYCNIFSKINNNNFHCLPNYKKGYELCLIYLGENHHLSIKYKITINKFASNKVKNRRIMMNKYEINSKLNEINNRLDKIGKSILPVKKIISNYKFNKLNKEENKNYFSVKNSRTEIYSKDILNIKKEEKKEKNYYNDDNSSGKNSIKNNATQFKIEMPKIIVNLNEDNNDELICQTLYQEMNSSTEEEKEKEKSNTNLFIPKININLDNTNNDDYICETFFVPAEENESNNNTNNNVPKININLDNTNNDDYICETFFIPSEENENNNNTNNIVPKININLDNTNNDDYICETFFIPTDKNNNDNNNDSKKENTTNNNFSLSFAIPEQKKDLSDNQLSNQELLNKYFIDLKFYREPFSSNYNPKNDLFDITKFLTELKENKENNESFKLGYKLRIFNNSNLLIKLEVLPNFNIRLFIINKDNKNDELLSTQYSFKKLLDLYKIIRYDLCLLSIQSYYDYSSYNEYISKTFLDFITISKEKEYYKFKMAKKPLGLCHSPVIITLYFSKVVFDILVIKQNYCKIILSSENDDFNSMGIDTYFDEESFDMLINKELIDNKFWIYSLKNNDLNKNEDIFDIIKNLQKCINGYCGGVVNVFDDMYLKANSNQKKIKELLTFKLDISNKLKNMKLSVCEFSSRLCKIITVDQNLKKIKGIIYSYQISELFGYETINIWNKLFSYQKLIFSQIILNSAVYNEENSINALDKHKIIDEFNFVFDKKICNFCLIKLKEIIYIKFMLYESIGTFEFNKVVFIKSRKNLEEIKLKNIKNKLLNEINKSIEDIKEGNDSLFSYINLE